MEARFIGDPRNGGDGPAVVTLWGHSFRKGEWAGVSDAGLFARLEKNNHFEAREGMTAATPVLKPKAEPAPEPVPVSANGIPADWRKLHHFKRIALAKSLDADLADTIKTAADADQIIEWHEGKDGTD